MNYKEEVLKVYPDAVCKYHTDLRGDYYFYIESANNTISEDYTKSEESAWASAAGKIHNQKVPAPTTITVTGCGDCPMYLRNWENHHICKSDFDGIIPQITAKLLHEHCPLKTSPITIKLNQ
jgi:hypothetical protein